MSPETNVEYATSPSFPVLHTEYLDFFPGQVPGKSMVIYESRKPVLGGYAPECIFVGNDSTEFSVFIRLRDAVRGDYYPTQKTRMGVVFGLIKKAKRLAWRGLLVFQKLDFEETWPYGLLGKANC